VSTRKLSVQSGAAAPVRDGLDTVLARLPEEQRAAAGLMHRMGMVSAFEFTRALSDVGALVALQQIKDEAAYEQLGLTWEQFCRALPGSPSRRVVDDRLLQLDELGAQFMGLAAELGLQRRTLRALRAVDADARPRLLESGEALEFPDGRVVPVDADHREELREAMEDFAGEMAALRETLRVGTEQMTARAEEITQLTTRVLELEKRDEIAPLSMAEKQWQAAFRELRVFADVVLRERPDPAWAMSWVRSIQMELDRVLDYAVAEQGADYDPDDEELGRAINDLSHQEQGS